MLSHSLWLKVPKEIVQVRSRGKSSILLQEEKHNFQTNDTHPIICASNRNTNNLLAPWHGGKPICSRHQGCPVPSHSSWLRLLWCNQPGLWLCPYLTRLKQFPWASHDPGDTITSHTTPGLDGRDYRAVLGPRGRVRAVNMSPFCSGGWSVVRIPRSKRAASPSCPPPDLNLSWRSHSCSRSRIIHVVSCCVIHDERLNRYDEWGRVS